ncbi:MAG: hypothetical protein ACREPI_11120, partial [Candidatus Dormibacterales bacterium]
MKTPLPGERWAVRTAILRAVDRRTIDVGGAERVYWVAPGARTDNQVLMVLHGSGIDGPRMAAWTGLAERGPEAGFTTVFPDAYREMWDDAGTGRRDGLDDGAFVMA